MDGMTPIIDGRFAAAILPSSAAAGRHLLSNTMGVIR
jgi:hypothetical protein